MDGLELPVHARAVRAGALPSAGPCADACFSRVAADHYDPDYEFLQQDLSNADQIPQQAACHLSPLPESLGESGPSFLGRPFQLSLSSCPQTEGQQTDTPPALPEKKRRSASSQTTDSSGCRVSYERHPSQYDNLSEDDLQNPAAGQPAPYTPFAAILPFAQGAPSAPVEFVGDFTAPESTSDPEKPPPLPEKKNKHSKPLWGCRSRCACDPTW